MQKFTLLLSSVFILVLTFTFSSCKEDEPTVNAKLSFADDAMSVNENAGTLKVEVILDKPAAADITVEYEVSGTALEGTTASSDYEISGKFGEVEINKGETVGTIDIKIKNDAIFEGVEIIEISLKDVDSDKVDITNDDKTEITISDDDVASKLSFATSTMTVNEDDNVELVVIEVMLDQPAAQNLVVEYEISGTALDSLLGYEEEIPSIFNDYYFNSEDYGKVTIASGETKGKIEIQIYTDLRFENDETIVLTLKSVSGGVQIGSADKTTVNIKQQNGKIIALVWDEAYTDVDMDLFLWVNNDDPFLIAVSNIARTTPQEELLFMPSILDNVPLGLSCTYYSGTASPMNFKVQFVDFVNSVVEPIANWDIKEGTYTLANRNKYDDVSGTDLVIVQTFEQVDGAITNISNIQIPTAGSRVRGFKLPPNIKKQGTGSSRSINF